MKTAMFVLIYVYTAGYAGGYDRLNSESQFETREICEKFAEYKKAEVTARYDATHFAFACVDANGLKAVQK